MSIVVSLLTLFTGLFIAVNLYKLNTRLRITKQLANAAIAASIDNNGYVYIDAAYDHTRVMSGSTFCQLRQDYRHKYCKTKVAHKRAKLALEFIENIAKQAYFKSQYNVVITAEDNCAPSLYLYIQTDKMNCMWSVKLIPNEDLDAVGVLLYHLVNKKYIEKQISRKNVHNLG